MAYEVTKLVKGHRYRYRVESIPDATTGRSKPQWTYLGRLGDDDVIVPRRESSAGNVERIVGAIVRLLERRNVEHVTVTVIAREAGVAPGTIYRHFRSRREAILAAVRFVAARLFERIGRLEGPIGDRETERVRLHAWVTELLRAGVKSPVFMQALPAIVDASGERTSDEQKRHDPGRKFLDEYLVRLTQAGMISPSMTAQLSSATFLAIEGVIRIALNERDHFPMHLIDDAAYLIDRAVFGPTENGALTHHT
jgi:AcrR family transcriptional regulator